MKHTTKYGRRPLVSVIMPVYNARKFVAVAIESILAQTVENFEFFIIDDHSTDSSWEVIKHFAEKDRRIKAFRNAKNHGLVKSLNSVIGKTRGRYVARMDADDISLPDRFEKQIALLERDARLVACGGQEQIIDADGSVIAEKYFPTDPATCYNMLANVMVIQPPLLMARGRIFRTLRYDNHYFKNDDISIHFKLLLHGSFSNDEQTIFQYRKRPDSLTHKHPKIVYFRALLVRINAMIKYGYRPALANVLLMLPESFIVALLPEKFITTIFEWIRHTRRHQLQAMAKLRLLFAKA